MVVVILGCTKNDLSTIVPVGTESYIDDILTVIPDSLRADFFRDFGELNEGAIPDSIEGSFVVAPKERYKSNSPQWPTTVTEPNMYMRFSRQHNGVVVVRLGEGTSQVTDTAFVMGNGDLFTAYYIEDKTYDVNFDAHTYVVRTKRGVIMKGQMTEEGIRDFYFANIIMEMSDNSNGVLTLQEPGSYFIYKDGDDIARRED